MKKLTGESAGSKRPRAYIAIDLKSFYASVECVERGEDPLSTHLVVADPTRTDKTICLAVSPSLKSYGVPGRPRLFEVVQKMQEVNREREKRLQGKPFSGASVHLKELSEDPALRAEFITAPPRMRYYMDYSARIYRIYLRYISAEDIHVYSVDEVFLDVTEYLDYYRLTPHALAMQIIRTVLSETGITATAGIGTNLYLAKVAMDIVAKHIPADADGVRIAELDELSYRQLLWSHTPLTDFWRVGRGTAKRLMPYGVRTMGDIARLSVEQPELLYRLFGVNAELLIDHAWGVEPCTIADIRAYRPENNSISSGQVLMEGYPKERAGLIVREMTDMLCLDLVEKGLVTDQIVLHMGYDAPGAEPGQNGGDAGADGNTGLFDGPMQEDRYGRRLPKPAHGSVNLGFYTSSDRQILPAVTGLFEDIADPRLRIRRIYVTANHVIDQERAKAEAAAQKADEENAAAFAQLSLFDLPGMKEDGTADAYASGKTAGSHVPETDQNTAKNAERAEADSVRLRKDQQRQEAILKIKRKYGKNAVLRGMNFEEGATQRERNAQIGGHRA